MTPGAYVHIPFCAHRCAYCSFVALEGRSEEDRFFEGVEREIRSRAGEIRDRFDSVYFGGGTPSYVDTHRLGGVLGTLEEVFGISPGAEITAEANPDDLTPGRLSELRAIGVNRLSIGVQSLVDAELAPLERRHDAAGAVAALRAAVPLFGSVSADLMIGIPGQTRESLKKSVDGLLSTGLRHLSVYLLEIEKAPRLVRLKTERPEIFADDEEMAARWEMVDDLCTAAGFLRYEISNWARPLFESRHNLKYWRMAPTLGFGPAAHSFDRKKRTANTGSMADYLRRLENGQSAAVSTEERSEDSLRREELMLGLRLSGGVPSSSFEEICSTLPSEAASRMRGAFEAGLVETVGDYGQPGGTGARRVRLTRRGVLLSNEVFALLV